MGDPGKRLARGGLADTIALSLSALPLQDVARLRDVLACPRGPSCPTPSPASTPGSPRRRRSDWPTTWTSCASRPSAPCRSTRRTWSPRRGSWPSGSRAPGLEHVEVSPTGGHPIVYADWLHAEGAPTVLVYGHYDVQPVDPLDAWVQPPFDPRVEHGRVYARGAADDKGQVHLHALGGARLARGRGGLPVNIRYVFEGEEESGSDALRRLAGRPTASPDGGSRGHQRHRLLRGQPPGHHGRPAGPDVPPGGRDRARARTSIRAPGAATSRTRPSRSPASSRRSRRRTARSACPASMTRCAPSPSEEHAQYRSAAARRGSLRGGHRGARAVRRAGLPAPRATRRTTDAGRERHLGRLPGGGSKTIIPASRTCQDQHAAGRGHGPACAPSSGCATRSWRCRCRASRSRSGCSTTACGAGWASTTRPPAPRRHASRRSSARRPYYLNEGGSIPAAASFAAILGLPVVLLGFTNPDDQAHSPNEQMVLANYEGGVRTIARYWQALADLPR